MKALVPFLLAAVAIAAHAKTADELLDEVIQNPGAWDQMCSLPDPVKLDPPLPVYSMLVNREFLLSDKNRDLLRSRREEVVTALVARMDAMDLAKLPAKASSKADYTAWPPKSGLSPRSLSGVLLEIIRHLNAIEVLPGLLKVEAQLDAMIVAAGKDSAAPVPALEVDGIRYPLELNAYEWVKLADGEQQVKRRPDAEEKERRQAILNCSIYQREILSTIAKLLRHQRFQPLLESEIEKTFADRLKAAAQSDELKSIKKPEDILIKSRGYIVWDPIQNMPMGSMKPSELPFTRELRAKIRGFGETYLAGKNDAKK